jgi:hypothetical protein
MVVFQSVEIKVPMKYAWNFLLDGQNWEKWWSKITKIKLPKSDRDFSGYIKWDNDSKSKITGFSFNEYYKSVLTIESKFIMTSFKFIPNFRSNIEFEIAQETLNGALFSDNGTETRKRQQESLMKFKKLVEENSEIRNAIE